MPDNVTKDMFNFSSVEGLPVELAKKVLKDPLGKRRVYLEILKTGSDAGHEKLTLTQIRVVAYRMGMGELKATTVRSHLNALIEDGFVRKASRQFYSITAKGLKAIASSGGTECSPDDTE